MSNNIRWPEVAVHQNQKEATINEQTSDIDSSLSETLILEGVGPFTPSVRAFSQVMTFSVDNAATSCTLQVPEDAVKLFLVDNTVGSEVCTVVKGATSLTVPIGVALPFYSGPDVDEVYVLTSYNVSPVDYIVSFFKSLAPQDSEIMGQTLFNRTTTFSAGLPGSSAYCQQVPSSNLSVDIQKNGASIGTVSFVASNNIGTFNFATEQILAPGDVISFVAPSPDDFTFGDISISIIGTVV